MTYPTGLGEPRGPHFSSPDLAPYQPRTAGEDPEDADVSTDGSAGGVPRWVNK